MPEEKTPLLQMVLLGIVRHALTSIGGWMLYRGYIDPDTHARLISVGAAQVVGWTFVTLPVVWSWLQKRQAWAWVTTALRLDERKTSPAEVPLSAPGPNKAL